MSVFSDVVVLGHYVCLLLAAGSVAACVDDDPLAGTHTSDLLNAPLDATNTWSVGVCAGPLNQDPALGPLGACLQLGTRCTGSLIAPDLVLTSRHCVHTIDYSQATGFCDGVFTSTPLSSDPVRVTLDPSVIGSSPRWLDVAEILLSPVSKASCAGDIAVLRLARPVAKRDARPIIVDLRRLDTHLPGEVAIVARGSIATVFDTTTYEVVSNDNGGLLRRKLEHVPVVCLANGAPLCRAPDIGAPFDADPFYLEIGNGTSLGDSGSAFLRQREFDRGAKIAIAVNSAGTADPVTGLPNFGFGVRLDWHASFLRRVLRDHLSELPPETAAE